ncbi:MAG: hypothetical protein WAP35_00270 [Solirubrobacterales bacterium]
MTRPEVRSHVPGRPIWLSKAASRGIRRSGAGASSIVFLALLALVFATAAEAKRGAVDQSKAATLLFMPGPIRSSAPLLADELEKIDGFEVGLFSPTLGRYSPAQMMLDIGQGARVASSLYSPVVVAVPGLVYDDQTASGCVRGWRALERRAEDTPGEIDPGLLGETLAAANASPAWVAGRGESTASALAAVEATRPDGCGELRKAQIVPPARLFENIEGLLHTNRLVVAGLPPGAAGLRTIRRLAASAPDRMLIVVQAPPDPARIRLLTVGIHKLDRNPDLTPFKPGSLTSSTTRRDGLIAATDIAPTILRRLAIAEPDGMQGQPIERAPAMTSGELREMAQRLELVAGRRLPFGRGVLVLFCLMLIAVLGLGRVTGRYEELARTSQRVVGLALLWLPALLLLSAALRPTRMIETDITAGGSILLALITDRLVRWPRAPWIPVLTTLAVHALDFALLGSKYTGESLLGSNPLYGARFFGVGNELEAVFTVSALIGVGAWLCDRKIKHPARWFAAAGGAMVMFLGLGRLGADVGGVVMVTAGFGVAAVYAARLRLTPARIALMFLVPVVALGLIIGLDAVSGGESHLSRTVMRADNAGDIGTVIDRRFRASINGAKSDGIWVFVLASLLLLGWAWLKRDRLMGRLTGADEDPAARRPYRAALVGGVAATIVGALANDSGPAILIIGTIYLLMGLYYLRGRPLEGPTP